MSSSVSESAEISFSWTILAVYVYGFRLYARRILKTCRRRHLYNGIRVLPDRVRLLSLSIHRTGPDKRV